jgi:two-component system NtrC family sensor kinase
MKSERDRSASDDSRKRAESNAAQKKTGDQRQEENRRVRTPPLPSQQPDSGQDASALLKAFEERIANLQAHVAELESRIAELRTSRDRLQHSLHEFLGIQELSNILRTQKDPRLVVETLLPILRKILDFEELGIFLFVNNDGGVEPVGPVSPLMQKAATDQYEEGILEWVVSQRRPLVIPWMESFGARSAPPAGNLILAPLIAGDHPLGVALLTTSRSSDEFTTQNLRILYFAVSHAAVAIQNALSARVISNTKDFLFRLLENAGDIIFSLDEQGRFNYINPRFEEIGDKNELVKQPYSALFKQSEIRNRIKNTLTRGITQIFDYEIKTRLGLQRKYTVNLVALKNEKGQRTGALGIMRDVTEVYRLQKKLLESERLAAYTQTVITLNHEINNPLTAVLGNLFLMEKEIQQIGDPKISSRLKVIQDNCFRIQNVIKKLEKIEELKTVSYLGSTKMVDIGNGDDDKDQ